VPWTCLTGNVQIADSWIYLYQVTGDERLWRAARAINALVRRTFILDGKDGVPDSIWGFGAGMTPIHRSMMIPRWELSLRRRQAEGRRISIIC
jgi:hypothetical protein